MTNEEISESVAAFGLEYAIQFGLDPNEFEDKELAMHWIIAQEQLNIISGMLDNY